MQFQNQMEAWDLINYDELVEGIVSLGLIRSEAEIYIYLVKQGPQKARNIAEALKINKQLLYRYLRGLKNKEIVEASFERPAFFSAVALDNSLGKLIEIHLKNSKAIEKEKDEILNQWNAHLLKL
jgi:sugar-specific transcriptional regulator TrmB